MDNQNYLTEEGLEKLKEELEHLKKVKRPEVVNKIAVAREFGDLSENAAYHDAREEQGFIEGRIMELEELIKKSIVFDVDKNKKDIVSIGSKIKVEFDGKTQEFEIVGATESDPMKGHISYISPLGESFMNKKVGEEFNVTVPKGLVKCKILEIE